MGERPFRVLAIASHPVQYQAPIFRRMAANPQLELHVAYCSMHGAEPSRDPDFGATVQWDVPLLDGYEWIHVKNHGTGAESFLGLRNSGLWKLIRDGNFDAVLCFVGYVRATFWIACWAAKSAGSAFLFGTDATTLAPRDGKSWKIAVKKIFWPRLFALADQVIVPSSGTRDLMRTLGIPEDHITLTPYCVDNAWWAERAAESDRGATRAAWGIPREDTVILFCAKLQGWKRPLDLLQAFARANVSNTWLVFAGDGAQRSEIESTAADLGIASRVKILGFVNQSQLPAIYKSADVMVLPSEYEPFAVVVNEAMCCGCPVIASDRVGAARDLIAPVEPKFVFPCGNFDALAATLVNALSDRAKLAAAARRFVAHMQSWSPEQNIAATIQAVERAVSHTKRGSGALGKSSSAAPRPPVASVKD
ncbi:MAG TPA: glycosyltransferase family 4 protein [Candidatus Acidoferrum sp.]|jgi:glycosyltransferase involved in cell wall biosynthesis